MTDYKELESWLLEHLHANKLDLKETLNQRKIKSTWKTFNEIDVKEFNELVTMLKDSELETIQRTQKGYISIDGKNKLINLFAWDVKYSGACIVTTILLYPHAFSFRISNIQEVEGTTIQISGRDAWYKFKALCLEQGIDLNDYKLESDELGKAIKMDIDKPLIKIYSQYYDIELTNVHHIDFHNSYPAGLCNTHPEFRKVVEPLYKGRNEHPENKLILNCVVGYMQSITCCGARWAHLSRDAIQDNNDRIVDLAGTLMEKGRKIIGYNTDGIWYQGAIYHGQGEGPNLGEWHNDHINCRFRAKSNGSYEFENEEDGYQPVVRGMTKLDKIKDRKHRSWGDIYQDDCEIIKYHYNKETMLIEEN